MKKLAFVVVLVAAIVGMVFGGISVASAGFFDPTPHPTCTPKPSPTPAPTPCCDAMLTSINALDQKMTSIQNELANVTMMESGSGFTDSVVLDAYTNAQIINRDNAQVRHVHLSYDFVRNPEGSIGVAGYVLPHPVEENFLVQHDNPGWYTEEFDAIDWQMSVMNSSGNNITYYIVYAWTETYTP